MNVVKKLSASIYVINYVVDICLCRAAITKVFGLIKGQNQTTGLHQGRCPSQQVMEGCNYVNTDNLHKKMIQSIKINMHGD